MRVLFVYGTLLRGQRYHDAYLGGARFLEAAATAPTYSLYDMGACDYPALVAQGSTSVAGELYEVDAPTLAALDELGTGATEGTVRPESPEINSLM